MDEHLADDPLQATPDWSLSAISSAGEDDGNNRGAGAGGGEMDGRGLKNFFPSEASSVTSTPSEGEERGKDFFPEDQVREMCKLLSHLKRLVPPPPAAAFDAADIAGNVSASSSSANAATETTVVPGKQQQQQDMVFQPLTAEDATTTTATLEEGELTSQDGEANSGGRSQDVQATPPRNNTDAIRRGLALNLTPPCRDVGPSAAAEAVEAATVVKGKEKAKTPSSNKKLEEMRGLLHELESANKKFASGSASGSISTSNDNNVVGQGHSRTSRIPRRRTLNFSSSSHHQQQQQEKTENSTRYKALESQIKAFQSMMSQVNEDLMVAKAEAAKKGQMLNAFQMEMQETAKSWQAEKEKCAGEINCLKKDNEWLKHDLFATKKQLHDCEVELERAVKLAAEFRLRAEESEESRSREDDEREQQWRERLQQASQESETFKSQLAKNAASLAGSAKEREELRARWKRDKEEMAKKQKELERALEEEKGRVGELEDYWHRHYQQEMEKIMKERVKKLQKDIGVLEANLQKEWDEERHRMQEAHSAEMEVLKDSLLSEYQKVLMQFAETKDSLEKGLAAARNEADCLREQLRLSERRQQIALWSATNPAADGSHHLNRPNSPAISICSSSPGVSTSNIAKISNTAGPSSLPAGAPPPPGTPPFLNNHHRNGGQRPRSSPSLSNSNVDAAMLLRYNASALSGADDTVANASPAAADSSGTSAGGALTREEKEAILRQFEKQISEAQFSWNRCCSTNTYNLGSAFLRDPSFMAQYRSMAEKLLENSTSAEDKIQNNI